MRNKMGREGGKLYRLPTVVIDVLFSSYLAAILNKIYFHFSTAPVKWILIGLPIKVGAAKYLPHLSFLKFLMFAAEVSGEGYRRHPRWRPNKIKTPRLKAYIYHCHLPDPSCFSLVTTFKSRNTCCVKYKGTYSAQRRVPPNWAKLQRIIELFTQKLSLSSQKYRFGIRYSEKAHSGARIRGQKGTGSRIWIRNTARKEVRLSTAWWELKFQV